MKNILIVYSERYNSPFDVFTISDKAFEVIFPNEIDSATIAEARKRIDEFIPDGIFSPRDPSIDYDDDLSLFLNRTLSFIEYRRIHLSQAKGIHATLYMDIDSLELKHKDRIADKINYQDKTILRFDYKDKEYKYLPYYDPKIDGFAGMKNFLYIDEISNGGWYFAVYTVTDAEFEILFGDTDITVVDELYDRVEKLTLPEQHKDILKNLWSCRVPKALAVNGIHAIVLDDSLEIRIKYYPTRKIEEAINPDGTALRPYGSTLNNKTAYLPYQYVDFNEEDPNLTYEQINDLWDNFIDNVQQKIGTSYQEEIVVKYSLNNYKDEEDV